MRAHSLGAMAVLCAATLFACGGDDDDDDGGSGDDGGSVTCEELAAIVGDCGGDLTEAQFLDEICGTFVLSGDCLEEAAAADCAEHDAENPSYQDVCFPSCSPDSNQCLDDDTIQICADGTEYIVFCESVCAQNMATYTGTCASEFEGMPSMNGEDVCWCE